MPTRPTPHRRPTEPPDQSSRPDLRGSPESRGAPQSGEGPEPLDPGDASPRERILHAAFAAFTEGGFAETSTLEIATRARVSKRELYTLVGNKQQMLMACIEERARRLPTPADLPAAPDRETLARVLATFGARLLREVSDPTVIAAFRLAIAEAERTPEVAHTLNTLGRDKARAALTDLLTQAQSSGLVDGLPEAMAEQFMALLWGDLFVGLLLHIADRPGPDEAEARARHATTTLLRLHPRPGDAPPHPS